MSNPTHSTARPRDREGPVGGRADNGRQPGMMTPRHRAAIDALQARREREAAELSSHHPPQNPHAAFLAGAGSVIHTRIWSRPEVAILLSVNLYGN